MPTARGGRVFLTVDFQPGRTLRYRFTSHKRIIVDWDPNAAAGTSHVQEQSEDFEMVVAYAPVEVDPYGASTIRAVVESVQARRSEGPGSRQSRPDAVETAQGRDFTIKVDPRGKMVETASLTALIQDLGRRAFRPDTSAGRIKEPDMIADFVASQWFLWDAESSVERPADGLTVGQRWSSQLSVPTPMVMRKARRVVYALAQVRPDEPPSPKPGRPALAAAPANARPPAETTAAGPLAVIRSTYSAADTAPADWPIPYAGRFQMSGTFGFLGSYEVLGLDGTGEELFNLRAGRIERRRQAYTLRLKAGLPPLGIKANPHITIEQTLTMELANVE